MTLGFWYMSALEYAQVDFTALTCQNYGCYPQRMYNRILLKLVVPVASRFISSLTLRVTKHRVSAHLTTHFISQAQQNVLYLALLMICYFSDMHLRYLFDSLQLICGLCVSTARQPDLTWSRHQLYLLFSESFSIHGCVRCGICSMVGHC